MKISNEQIIALQENEARRKTQAVDEGFGTLLTQQLGSEAQGVASAIAPLEMKAGLLQGVLQGSLASASQNGELANLTSAQGMFEEASGQLDDMFAGFDGYAAQLTSTQPNAMRAAYGQLETMTDKIAKFRAAFPDMEKQHPELASMVNELDVLATTERFKFNRGDYL